MCFYTSPHWLFSWHVATIPNGSVSFRRTRRAARQIPSGKLRYITMENDNFNGKIHHKWSFSIAMLNYQRVYTNTTSIKQTCKECLEPPGEFPHQRHSAWTVLGNLLVSNMIQPSPRLCQVTTQILYPKSPPLTHKERTNAWTCLGHYISVNINYGDNISPTWFLHTC